MSFRLTRYRIKNVPPGKQVDVGNLTLCDENRSVLHGRVIDCNGQPVEGAVVKIFSLPAKDTCGKPVDPCDCHVQLTSEGHTFTDECGEWLFPVCATNKMFLIKIFAFRPTDSVFVSAKRCEDGLPCCDPPCDKPPCPPCHPWRDEDEGEREEE
ncbi:MAG: hypothetical protein ACUVTU_12575 [Desulfurispora sp.]|uniref:hypothetical protein n=1 Tax=Desulfurispora sp. TaxID=3014275 RepID=UPI00404A82E3